jgi:hypothetical protein
MTGYARPRPWSRDGGGPYAEHFALEFTGTFAPVEVFSRNSAGRKPPQFLGRQNEMRKTVIGSAAAATVAVTGLAFAQEGQSGQEQNPAAGQIERSQSNHPAAGATGKEGAAAPAQGL